MTPEEREAWLIQRLRDVADEAAEDVEQWGNYAADYFQQKWNLAGTIAYYRAIADADDPFSVDYGRDV